MDNLKMHSLDGVQRNIDLIGKLFPNAITEVKRDGKVEHAIDFDVLRQELSDSIVEGREERYQFTWPDKKKAMLAANAPITATLRPVVADSFGKDGTPGGFDSENLYIEGDNLEVLKLLQETYLGKVKMIYIDPPYNTGNDFVYEDDFAQSAADYMDNSGQYDEEGNRMVTNTESNGRFHTDWLNMIYPRLKLAKDLLAEDGVIFISIDDNEIENSLKVCSEVFGKENYLACFPRVTKKAGKTTEAIARNHDYLAAYVNSASTSDIEKLLNDLLSYYEENYEQEYTENLTDDEYSYCQYNAEYARLYKKCRAYMNRVLNNTTPLAVNATELQEKFSSQYLSKQIELMLKMQSENPTDAIGKAKELIESCCKTILDNKGVAWDKNWNMGKLTGETLNLLNLTPESISKNDPVSENIKAVLGNLRGISTKLAEIRNPYGSGHGKSASFAGLETRHAKLAVGCSITFVTFLWDTYEEGMS